ncbi:hypothetical protein [Streptomyces sp. NPDC021212]|uniref:effector-associated constant component EACC1 n=1 Tax=Streptomyces sp. NPDC021212 TaxID=3365118 RepID=UPI0037980A32
MRIDVAVSGGEEELRSLHDWLRRDPSVRRGAQVELARAAPSPGQMGVLTDVLQLVTDNAEHDLARLPADQRPYERGVGRRLRLRLTGC